MLLEQKHKLLGKEILVDEFGYLQSVDQDTILNTWYSLGQMTVNSKTKVYTKGSVVRIDASDGDGLSAAPLHNKIVYVLESYKVDNNKLYCIDWENVTIDDVTGLHAAFQGIQLPYFGVLNAKWNAGFMPDQNFLPYQSSATEEVTWDNGGISISDIELETILTEVGFPFVTFADLEFAKSEIIKYFIRPALQRYYTFRPIIDEQPGWQVSVGNEFLVEFPDNAFGCIPYYTVPGGGGFGAKSGSPFAFYNEQMLTGTTYGAVGSRFGRGVTYRGKAVPGYVGLDNRTSMLDNLAVQQGFLNHFRREKYSKKRIDGKLYAYGFTTIGGNLNFKWLKWSPNWDDIPFSDLEVLARPMAKINVLNNFGVLRSLVKSDIAGQLDATVLTNRAEKLENELKPIISSIGLTGMHALIRGGG